MLNTAAVLSVDMLLLLMLHTASLQELTDLRAALAALTAEEKEDECISHVIKLRRAWAEGEPGQGLAALTSD